MIILYTPWRLAGRGLPRRWAMVLLLGLCAVISEAGAATSRPAYLGERLAYTASYEGLLSGGSRLNIADVLITTDAKPTPFNGEKAYKTSLVASSKAYGALEHFYRFRYEYSSLLSTDLHRSLLFEQRKGEHDQQHTVVWFDWKHNQLAKFRKKADPEQGSDGQGAPTVASGWRVLAQIGLAADASSYESHTVKGPAFPSLLLDRLSLLQVLRVQDLDRLGSLKIPVSDGKSLLEYRVRLVGRERLEVDALCWQTYHLRLTAFDLLKGADSEQAPVDIWLADDPAHTPVRFLSQQKLGRFDIRLRTAMATTLGEGDPRSTRLIAQRHWVCRGAISSRARCGTGAPRRGYGDGIDRFGSASVSSPLMLGRLDGTHCGARERPARAD